MQKARAWRRRQALATVVVEPSQEYVAVGRSFTAYHVTRALRDHAGGASDTRRCASWCITG